MKNRWITSGTVLAITVAGLFFLLRSKRAPEPQRPVVESVSEPVPMSLDNESVSKNLIAPESIPSIHDPKLLRDYGLPETSIKNDLKLVNNVLQRFWLLFKNPDLLRVGSNEEIIQSLTGGNPDGIRFISPDNDFIDDKGRLTDRWGTPLFFHPVSLTRIEIRSAGPDQTLFTEDDTVFDSASSIRMH